jgi:hypothetical protein
MGKVEECRAALRALDVSQWPAYLTEHSGLPGPRGNIELGQAVADEGDLATFERLIGTGDEYLTFCGVVGLGAVLTGGADRVVEEQLRSHAAGPHWRIREGVAMALQRLGDAAPERLFELVATWADDPDPLVQRAAVAGICEPRLLTTPAGAAAALAVCTQVTASLGRRPAAARRDSGVRTLRQGLGYCWSVAVAADPAHGLPAFRALERSEDPDVAWIVRENRTKKRLAALL